MYVIGTAGHVDHGKSTLIEALTGIDPDRLIEEKTRAMTIDLGFAWMPLEIGDESQEVGIVDVPGHRDFIENMLAGIGGIDLALFVVAADEGVMPQTREHLAIIDLLQISSGVVALTKTDLIADPEWLDLVTLDLQETLADTSLAEAPIIPVSARTGEGLSTLRDELARQLSASSPRADLGRPRLPIDRVFTLSGFGTIITGTLVGGRLTIGDAVEIQPGGLQGRIRGLQTHKTKREMALPGSRVAVNIAGVEADAISRGQVLGKPGQIRSTVLVDVQYRHLQDATSPLKHNREVKLFTGASEVMARTRVLGVRSIAPGETGWLQLALQEPISVERGERYILRRPSPGATLGGGQILDPSPGRRHRRFRTPIVERLRTLAEGTPQELMLQKLERLQPVTKQELFRQLGLPHDEAEQAWRALVEEEEIVQSGSTALTANYWKQMREAIVERSRDHHTRHPLRRGIPREELRNKLDVPISIFNTIVQQLAEEDRIVDAGSVIHDPTHTITFTVRQQSSIDELVARFQTSGVNSPSVKDCRSLVGDEVYEALLELDVLRQLNEEVAYLADDVEEITGRIVAFLEAHGPASAADIRDLLDTSRKYAIAILEYLDQKQVTRRVDDRRELVASRSKTRQGS